MSLTAAQQTTLAADIAANTAVLPAGRQFAGVAVQDVPHTADGAYDVAWWYSQPASPAYKVWDTRVNLKDIRSLVNLAQFTPADAVPASAGSTQNTNDQLVFQNRALACQLKQANAIFLITGEGQIDASPLQLRYSFNDCMTQIPSGASGANQNAGWGTSAAPGAVRLKMQRDALAVEKVFSAASTAAPNAGNVGADPRGGTTNPDTLVYVGTVSDGDIRSAWGI